jgi:uncharacterized Zn finger protein (UPF0148 family)
MSATVCPKCGTGPLLWHQGALICGNRHCPANAKECQP